ncbi:hypothetical protein SASPL_103981 [Salvia splendens]|uniref:rRNA adenine N(6)-methyltransferase n=1 Tax=Salvia splendens TaxID=180675 RepID=A0A8X8YGB8_SALSN|nr:hypothetical protein SASPL_103981 [Salvia splendens]
MLMVAMNSLLLHPVRPILSFHKTRDSALPPSHDILAAGNLDDAPPRLRGNSSSTTSKRKQDDYHSTLKALNSKGRFPRKSLGQHYMVNGSVNEELVAAANVKEGDFVLEIGPGTGSLTNALLEAGATVLAIEKIASVISKSCEIDNVRPASGSLYGITGEGTLQWTTICEAKGPPEGNSFTAKVVANIPFNISTDVVKQLLPMGDIFSEVVLLLQDEAAQRFVDPSLRSSEHRPINVFVNFYSDPEYKLKVPRSNFFPQPKVDAAVVAFKLKQPADYPHVSSLKSFFSMVNSAFNGKRKMLRKSLHHICPSPDIEAALCALNLPPTSRPEELTLDDFVKLHNLIVDS